MEPLVSVIIPSFNHEKYIEEAVDSVLSQSYRNIELIVVDDGSTDGSLQRLQRYSSRNILLFPQENQGAHEAINKGLEMSQGEYLCILNSDDVYFPDRIEYLVDTVRAGNHKFVFTDLQMIDSCSKNYTGPRYEQYQFLKSECETLDPELWFSLGNVVYTTSNFFFTRECMEEVGKFINLRFTHDWNWLLRYISVSENSNHLCWVRECLLFYRVHGKNTLSETDLWYSIFEDSYNISCYLNRISNHFCEKERIVSGLFVSLCKNDSYLPVFVNLFLLILRSCCIGREDRLLEIINDVDFRQQLRSLVGGLRYDLRAFLSTGILNKMLHSYSDAVDSQTQLIDERDAYIAELEKKVSTLESNITLFENKVARIESRYSGLLANLGAVLDQRIQRAADRLHSLFR